METCCSLVEHLQETPLITAGIDFSVALMPLTRIAKKIICRYSDWFLSRCSEGKSKLLCPGLGVEGGRKQHFMGCSRNLEDFLSSRLILYAFLAPALRAVNRLDHPESTKWVVSSGYTSG